jgi:hypothetical protein
MQNYRLKRASWVIGLVVFSFAQASTASQQVLISILGSKDGGATFSNSLTVTPGQSLTWEILAQLAPVGTQNSHGNITSVVAGTDGINSLAFNVIDSDSGTFNVASLQLVNGWNGGSGFGVGTVNGNTLTDVRPIQAPGVEVAATAPLTVLTGTFTAGSFSGFSSEVLSGSWATTGTTSGGFKINGGTTKVITTTTEGSSDPYVGFSSLTLSTVPEPTMVSCVLFGAAFLMRRRVRSN